MLERKEGMISACHRDRCVGRVKGEKFGHPDGSKTGVKREALSVLMWHERERS